MPGSKVTLVYPAFLYSRIEPNEQCSGCGKRGVFYQSAYPHFTGVIVIRCMKDMTETKVIEHVHREISAGVIKGISQRMESQ